MLSSAVWLSASVDVGCRRDGRHDIAWHRGQLLDYVTKNTSITKYQFGCMKRRSTCAHSLESLNDWVTNQESKLVADVMYFHFRNVFDSVSLTKLLIKLEGYNLTLGNLMGWIDSFLFNRTQVVKSNNFINKQH